MKVVEVRTSRDLNEAEKFDRLDQTNQERHNKLEAVLKVLRETESRSIIVARRDLDLIKVFSNTIEIFCCQICHFYALLLNSFDTNSYFIFYLFRSLSLL